MAEGVVALGAEVSVVTTDADGDGRMDVPLNRPVSEGGVTYRFFGRTLPGSWKYSRPLSRWLNDHIGEFDVVHVHALFSHSTIPACRAAARAGVPYLLRPLGTLDPWSLRHRSWKKAPYLRLVERTHLRHAAAIHVTSVQEARAVEALCCRETIRCIPLGVRLPSERVPDSRARHPGPVRVLFLSRIHPKKGLPLLLEALARLEQERVPIELLVAGSGEPAYEERMRALSHALGVAGRVRFLGHVEGDAKRRLLAESDLFVLPSHQENFGIAVVEAMAAGLPVVVSDQVGVAAEVAAGGAGLIVPHGVDGWARAIETLANDAPLRAEMGERGLRTARERFSLDASCRLLLDLYRELAGAVRP